MLIFALLYGMCLYCVSDNISIYIIAVNSMDPFSCSNAVIDGSESKSLLISRAKHNHFHGQNITIYGPKGKGSELIIRDSIGHEGFSNSNIFANNTDTIYIRGSHGNKAFANNILYAYEASNITIHCGFGFFNCQNMKIYTYHESFSLSNPLLPGKLTIICHREWDDECDQLKVFILYNNYTNTWSCMYTHSDTGWDCIPFAQTLSPTNIPTKSTNIPTILPNIPKILPTINPTISPLLLPSQTGSIKQNRTLKVIIFTNIIVFGVVVSCCCIIVAFAWRYKNKDFISFRKSSTPTSKSSSIRFSIFFSKLNTKNTKSIPNNNATDPINTNKSIEANTNITVSVNTNESIPDTIPGISAVKSKSHSNDKTNNDDNDVPAPGAQIPSNHVIELPPKIPEVKIKETIKIPTEGLIEETNRGNIEGEIGGVYV